MISSDCSNAIVILSHIYNTEPITCTVEEYDKYKDALKTAISALKRQMPVNAVFNESDWYWHCGNCNAKIVQGIYNKLPMEKINYCSECGKKMAWND